MSPDPKILAHFYIESLIAQVGNIRELGLLNEGKELSPTPLQNLLAGKFASQALSPSAAFFVAGAYEKHQQMPLVFKTFLGLVADKWGFSLGEALKLLAVLIVFGGTKKEELNLAGLSRSLILFLNGEPSRTIKPIASGWSLASLPGRDFVAARQCNLTARPCIPVSLFFIDTLARVLTTQILEVNRKYRSAPPELQEKLVKLYSAPERRGMIAGNAARHAFDRIASHASESLEIAKLFKVFTKKMPHLCTPEDLFAADYTRLPVE